MASDALLRALTQQEKLAFFYCAYVREEVADADAGGDGEALRWWDKVAAAAPASSSARRKARERVCWLLQQVENATAADVRHMDAAFRAKRELLLLAEGSIRSQAAAAQAPTNARPARNGGAALGDPQALERLERARANNELLHECGALPVFSDLLQQSVHAFRGLNFQHLDLDKVDQLVGDLQRDMTLMYLLIVFNAHRQNAVFDRQLMVLGIGAPTYSLVTILDCLSQLNVLPGFPIKRLLLLFHEWFAAVLGNFDSLAALKKLRRERNGTDPSVFADEAKGRLTCKTLKKTYHDTAVLENQDPYYLQKLKFAKMREEIHNKYLHKPMYELKLSSEESDNRRRVVDDDDPARATAPLDALDDEWEERCEQVYQLFLPCMREYTTFLSNLVTLSCGSALNARDKKTFYSRRPSSGDQLGPMYTVTSGDNYGMGNMGMGGGPDSNNDNQFWKWILREKTIVLDVACLTILLIFKHFRASHACKAEYFMQFFLENNLLATLTKFMNKDIATYLRQDSGGDDPKSGFYALERELEKLNLRVEDDVLDYSLQSTRTITSILRILQKLTKRKPNIIKNGLCRSSSIVWLKVSYFFVVHVWSVMHSLSDDDLCFVVVAGSISANPATALVCAEAGEVPSQVSWCTGAATIMCKR